MRKTITLYIQRTLICVVVFLCLKQLNAQTPPVIQWQKSYGGSDDDIGMSVVNSQEGGFLLGGYTRSEDGDVESNHGKIGRAHV